MPTNNPFSVSIFTDNIELVYFSFFLFLILLVLFSIAKKSSKSSFRKVKIPSSIHNEEQVEVKNDRENVGFESVLNDEIQNDNQHSNTTNYNPYRRRKPKHVKRKFLFIMLSLWLSLICYVLWFDVLISTDWGFIVFIILTSLYVMLGIKGVQLLFNKNPK